jgi:peptidyl-dipeptidase Dcp
MQTEGAAMLETVPQPNPLLESWPGPYGGVPPFDRIAPPHFPRAFDSAMAEHRAEIAAIAGCAEPPTFENTVAALEDAGRTYGRVMALWSIFTSTFNTREVQAIDLDWQPRFAAFADEVTHNPRLFARLEAVHDSEEKARLTPEQRRLVWKHHNGFVRQGARLAPEAKAQLSACNQQLASLYTRFSQNELADEEQRQLVLERPEDLEGLPASLVDGYAAAAAEKGLAGKWVVANTRSAMEPFLTFSGRRDLREAGWRMWTLRGDNGDLHDNNAICTEILQLRARRAKLLGYETHAHWRLEDSMARTPGTAMALMLKVWPAAVARARAEAAELQALADREGAGIRIEPWDWRYYAEKVRKAAYDLDQAEVKPYLQLDRLEEALHWTSGELFGLKWSRVHDAPTAHPDISVHKVEGADGALVGLWYFDPYARKAKQSGAWMNEYRTQERFRRPVAPIVSNNCNFVPGPQGEPVLISWDDAVTMFHEFGHALHGLVSCVDYPGLAGTNVARDFVELPSQLNERWLPTHEVLSRFARHTATGAPMPEALAAKIKAAETFNQGFAVVEYLASAIVDMRLHLEGESPIDTHAFERRILEEIGMPREIAMRHRIPHFGHVFGGDGYSAGYYSYLWSEVLAHDAFEAFLEAGGPFDAAVASRYRRTILAAGDTAPPEEAWRAFRGRDPDPDAYFRAKGFPVSGAA